MPFCAVYVVVVPARVGGIGYAFTWNSQLVNVYYIVHFYLLPPIDNLDRVENRLDNIYSHVRGRVHVTVEVKP